MTSKLYKRNLALVGAGYWGKNLARNFNQLGPLHTICDRSEELLNNFKTEDYFEVKLTTSLDAVLNEPEISKVAIAVPAALHYQMAKKALEAGKDVFVEKPLCLDVNQGEELVSLAKQKGKILMVGHLLQYHPCIIELQEMIKKGKLGKLYYLTSNRLNLGKIRKEENALWSFAPHDISVILSLVGNQKPKEIRCIGESYLNDQVADTTLTTMRFESGTRAHIYVSWLNPFKEQKLTVVGSEGMAVFDDSKPWSEKLILHENYLFWDQGQNPTPIKKPGLKINIEETEPLRNECLHFLKCCDSRRAPKTDGIEALSSLKVLTAAQQSLENSGKSQHIDRRCTQLGDSVKQSGIFIHDSSIIDEGAEIGEGTHIWHFSHVFSGAKIGENCNIGQNVVVSNHVVLGPRCKIQNNVSLYSGVECEADVFLGPSCVLTNISNPRSEVNRKRLYEKTLFRKGATVGANATIICGVTIGRYAFIAAGSVVTKGIPDYALVLGNPAYQVGWMSRHGHRLKNPDSCGIFYCPESGLRYQESNGRLSCLDHDEETSLPVELQDGKKSYGAYKKNV